MKQVRGQAATGVPRPGGRSALMVGRSVLTQEFAVAGPFGDGPVAVTGFVHPERGPVDCPAAPLLAAWLWRVGGASAPVRTGPLRERLAAGPPGRGAAVLTAMTYHGPEGGCAGLAVAAPPAWRSRAAQAVRVWSAAVRTRRVLVPAAAPCAESTGPGLPCACAERAGAAARRFAAEGDEVFVVGGSGSGAREAWGDRGWTWVADARQARRVEPVDAQAVAFVLRPGTSVRSAAETVAVLRGRFPSLRGQHPDQWCYRADDREEAVSRAVSLSDVALLLGAEVLPRPSAVRCHRLGSLVDLLPGHVRAASTVALVDGTPEGQGGRDLLRALHGLGPVSVLRLRAASERAGSAATVPEGRRGDGSGSGPVPAAMDTGTM
ncbi:hypothetical protein ACFVT9_35690 [Kitasatospora cineracea]|uniref:hypothetical protein n=1 Tax=Kitasatospora cineracea TaxID=88074 RepID=UPI0036DD2463